MTFDYYEINENSFDFSRRENSMPVKVNLPFLLTQNFLHNPPSIISHLSAGDRRAFLPSDGNFRVSKLFFCLHNIFNST
jgi:hypothetical protein